MLGMTGGGQVSSNRKAGSSWHTAQSAALPYRWSRYGLQVLLVTSRATRRWVVPKGSVKADLGPSASAALEAYEEAGVDGRMSRRCLGIYGYAKKNGRRGQLCLVEVYPLRVLRVLPVWPECRQRRREWTTFAVASVRVHEPALKRILLSYEQRLLRAAHGGRPQRRVRSGRTGRGSVGLPGLYIGDEQSD